MANTLPFHRETDSEIDNDLIAGKLYDILFFKWKSYVFNVFNIIWHAYTE